MFRSTWFRAALLTFNWLLLAWITFSLFKEYELSTARAISSALVSLVLVFFTYAICEPIAATQDQDPKPTPTRRHPERFTAYLVVHLDLSVSPPMAKFVTTYSSSAKDLTLTGLNEARADLYMCEAPTLEEALEHLRYIQPTYFPWATPLMTRNR